MQFFRFDFNIDGIKADAKKVEAIVDMKFPILPRTKLRKDFN